MAGGVLAYAFFPSNRCGEQLATVFNTRVSWSRGLFLDTLTHELGHAFGLPHTNDRRDIMFPSIITGRALDGKYGPYYSIPELVRRYGPASPTPLPPGGNVFLKLLLQILSSLPPSFWEAVIKAIIDAITKNPAAFSEAIQLGLASASVDENRGPVVR